MDGVFATVGLVAGRTLMTTVGVADAGPAVADGEASGRRSGEPAGTGRSLEDVVALTGIAADGVAWPTGSGVAGIDRTGSGVPGTGVAGTGVAGPVPRGVTPGGRGVAGGMDPVDRAARSRRLEIEAPVSPPADWPIT